MTRLSNVLLSTALLPFAILVQTTLAQTATPRPIPRATYQEAYRNWRLADPNLEADASTNPASFAARASNVSALSGKYFAVRKAYMNGLAQEIEQAILPLGVPMSPPAVPSATTTQTTATAVDQYLGAQMSSTGKNLAVIPNSPDIGFQELRRALERERAALSVLRGIAEGRQKDKERSQEDDLAQSLDAIQKARNQVIAHGHEFASDIAREGLDSEKSAASWSSYYQALADGAQRTGVMASLNPKTSDQNIPAPPPAAAVATTSVNAAPVNLQTNTVQSASGSQAEPVPAATADESSSALSRPMHRTVSLVVKDPANAVKDPANSPASANAPASPTANPPQNRAPNTTVSSTSLPNTSLPNTSVRSPTVVIAPNSTNSTAAPKGTGNTATPSASPAAIDVHPERSTDLTPAPISRYLGAWVYPTVGEHYHGARPETVDLELKETNGFITGTFRSHFRTQQIGLTDPVLVFSFSSMYMNTRSQTFALITSSGAKGTLELIPATALNLIEVIFSTEEQPGKITKGNFFLTRK